MQNWEFTFLGDTRATQGQTSLEDIRGKKTGALLALLALSPGRPQPRESVIDLIWPEVDFDEARNRFRQQLFLLRKQLEPAGVKPGSVLIATRTHIGLAAEHHSDVAQFQQHLRNANIATEPNKRALHLRSALALYQGEFAPGFYLDVLLTERERLATLAQGAREKLAALEAATPAPLPKPEPPSVTLGTKNRFFGRQQEREQLAVLRREHRLITVLGPGGTGKTRLLQELQTDLENAFFIPLSGQREGKSLPDAIVAALTLPESNDTALVRLQNALVQKPTVFILDNVEQLVENGAPEAIQTLLDHLPTLRILVTSRLKLDLPQECVFTLAPLPSNDAVALFIDRARLAKSDFEPSHTINELCQRLDGLPLAIELAAARAAVLTPAQMLERLARRFDLLADKRRDRDERHRSLRAALDWGWGLLAPDVQRFFAQLCVFRGSFSLDAAETVTGEWLAIDYLQSLADASFLLVEGERFRLLETLREYGSEKLGKDESAALQESHASYFLAKATTWYDQLTGATYSSAMSATKTDYANLIAAGEHLLQTDPSRAVDLAGHLGHYWEFSYQAHEGLPYLIQLLTATENVALRSGQRAMFHGVVGNAYESIHQFSQAYEHNLRSLHYRRQQIQELAADLSPENQEKYFGARRQLAGALHNLGNALWHQEKLEEAEVYWHDAMALNRELDNKRWLSINLNCLTQLTLKRAHTTMELEERQVLIALAADYADEAVSLTREAQQANMLCWMYSLKLAVLMVQEKDREGLALLAEAFPLACQLQEWSPLVNLLYGYHHLAAKQQHYEHAVQFLGAAYGNDHRWTNQIKDDAPSHEWATSETIRRALPTILGQERYDLLYQAGYEASLESLQALAAELHAALENQPQPLRTTR